MPQLEIVNEEYMDAMRACVVSWMYNGKPDGFTVHPSKLSAQLYASVVKSEVPELSPSFRSVKCRQNVVDILDELLGPTEVAVFGVGNQFDDAEWLREDHLLCA